MDRALLAVWGGVERTESVSELSTAAPILETGHEARLDDLPAFAALWDQNLALPRAGPEKVRRNAVTNRLELA